jgi:DNA-binding beta-propeller fold protein YncE
LNPEEVAVEASGRFVYAPLGTVNSYPPGTKIPFAIEAFGIDNSSGALTQIVGSPFAATNPTSITLDPSGKFAFVVTDGGIFAYTIDSTTGVLTAVAGSPFFQGDGGLISVAISPIP